MVRHLLGSGSQSRDLLISSDSHPDLIIHCFLVNRRVFRDDCGDLDLRGEFTSMYRQESNKLSNEDLLKQLQDIKRNPEKLSKLTEIPGTLKVSIEPFSRMLSSK